MKLLKNELKMRKNNAGISMITLVIAIVILMIIASVAIGTSMRMIDQSSDARKATIANEENDIIRSLLRYTITDSTTYQAGIALHDNTLVVIGSGDIEYGTGYYLIPGGTDRDLQKISKKVGDSITVERYKDLTASYVVDYDNDWFERIEEIEFKGE